MTTIATRLFLVLILALGILLVLFLIYSFKENEKRAVGRSAGLLVLLGLILIGISYLPGSVFPYLFFPLAAITVLMLLKFGNKKVEFGVSGKRYDERDVMFSRNALGEGTERFEGYYKMRPENRKPDDEFRKLPGLMEKGSLFYDETRFAAAHATFSTVDLLQRLVEKETRNNKTQLPPGEIAEFIKKWTLKLGAADVGFTLLKPHHVYTHIGRGEHYGQKVELDHKYAIAFTVEMDHTAMSYNPKSPVVMESAQQYLNAGTIAVQLAELIRNLGYSARAHIDANYRVICPTVAMDAGLGTIGRMGLLMTPKLGPRVRIGVVTTDLELDNDEHATDHTAIDFCERCKKCAENCPSQSISFEPRKDSEDGRWTIDHQSCFTYWCKAGTDCGRCMAVCPYSHPDNFIHNLMRWLIRRNPVNRWMALKLDDFFYGRKPGSKKI